MNEIKIVHILWLDSQGHAEWQPIDAITDPLELTHTVGIMIKETENSVVVSLSYDPHTDSAHCYKHIPLCAISKMRTICTMTTTKT